MTPSKHLNCYHFLSVQPDATPKELQRALNVFHNRRADTQLALEAWAREHSEDTLERHRKHSKIVQDIIYWERQYEIAEACHNAILRGEYLIPAPEESQQSNPIFEDGVPRIRLSWVTPSQEVQARILKIEAEFKMVGDACDQFRYQLIRWGKYRRQANTLTEIQLWEVAQSLDYNDPAVIHGIQIVCEMFPGTENYSEQQRYRLWQELTARPEV